MGTVAYMDTKLVEYSKHGYSLVNHNNTVIMSLSCTNCALNRVLGVNPLFVNQFNDRYSSLEAFNRHPS